MDAAGPTSPLAAPAPAVVATRSLSAEWGARPGRRPTDASTYVVTVDPHRSNVLRFGAYTLDIPGNAICNRDGGYGLGTFDLDCRAERNDVTITAIVRTTASGVPRIDLQPEMRFSPKRTVTLSLHVSDFASIAPSPTILYCATPSTDVCVDESVLDPTLVTYADAATSTVFRRIKHFSGYFVQE